jgi:hypothetical protein
MQLEMRVMLTTTVLAASSTLPTPQQKQQQQQQQPSPPPMANLLFPKWKPTYNLTMSTMTQTCFGPVTIGKPAPILTNETGAFLKHWGVVALDFETEENIWADHRPKDADVMMIEQAAVIKKMAPDTRVWVYRNLVQPYANFVQLREKIEDPAFSGWFVHFGPDNDPKLTPQCELNPRLNKTLYVSFRLSLYPMWCTDAHFTSDADEASCFDDVITYCHCNDKGAQICFTRGWHGQKTVMIAATTSLVATTFSTIGMHRYAIGL